MKAKFSLHIDISKMILRVGGKGVENCGAVSKSTYDMK